MPLYTIGRKTIFSTVHTLRRLGWVIWSPSRAFRTLQDRPVWFGAFLVIGLGNAASVWVSMSILQNQALSPFLASDQLQRITDFNKTILYLSIGGSFLLTPIHWFAGALLIWLIVQVCDCRISMINIYSLIAHAQISALLSGGAVIVLLLAACRGSDLQHLEMLMEAALSWKPGISPLAKSMLLNLNPFVLWYYGLLAFGLRILGKVSWCRATGVIVAFWGVSMAFGTIMAWAMSGMMSPF